MKYYSVYRGKSGVPKIFTNWAECKAEVIGCKGAIYKSFGTEKEAIEFLSLMAGGKSSRKSESESAEDVESNGLIIYVDGSFMVDKGNFSYGLIALNDGEVIHEDSGVGFDKEAIPLRNVSGEVLGAMKAVEFAINNNFKEVTIAFDYQGIECWALGTWKRNNLITSGYHDFMKENMKKIDVRFKKIKGHSGNKYNDIADKLAKNALINN
ncbi:ribonuclease H1 domain-containing protein [Clostridium sp.]|uniref:ribonuclease H1 domain-containing protein n=1 Tax=Clostridium sp. TaxID=1506 RepID=UPI003F2FE3E6